HRRSLARRALERLLDEDIEQIEKSEDEHQSEEAAIEQKARLHDQRLKDVHEVIKSEAAKRVLDLGCGEGKLLKRLLRDRSIHEIVGMDVSYRAIERAADRLRLDSLPTRDRNRIKLIHGSLMYRDKRLSGFDAATVVEVVEHLDPPRLAAFERVVFEFAKPETVIITTPNREYNIMFENLQADKYRHHDHRFEWTRGEFEEWSMSICERFGYEVEFRPIGAVDEKVGAPTQMGVFRR
ncbi:MAG: methyltransferase, partial [Candidatus Korarchaeota archaeon]|nr:methyltransferase [Candidatus Korarchaeota archaeon]